MTAHEPERRQPLAFLLVLLLLHTVGASNKALLIVGVWHRSPMMTQIQCMLQCLHPEPLNAATISIQRL